MGSASRAATRGRAPGMTRGPVDVPGAPSGPSCREGAIRRIRSGTALPRPRVGVPGGASMIKSAGDFPREEQDAIATRAGELFAACRRKEFRTYDRLLSGLLVAEWLAAIVTALVVSPRAWAGPSGQWHVHAWAAIWLGGAIASLPVLLALAFPGQASTRHVIAVG